MHKTFILDTNVLLSDSNALYAFAEHNVVLPLIVLEELDRHKDRQDETGKNARETVRKLTAITKDKVDSKSGIVLGEGFGKLFVVPLQDLSSDFDVPKELEKFDTGDNTIIKFCLAYNKTFQNQNNILVTRDLLLQIKCNVLNISWEPFKRLSAGSKYSSGLYSGVQQIDDFDVDAYYAAQKEGGYTLPERYVEEYNLHPNQFLVLTSGSQSALARFVSKNKSLVNVEKQHAGKLSPRNKEQEFAMNLLYDENVKLVSLAGLAGGGKTLIALACGIEQVIGGGKKKYKNLLVCRPIQPVGKDIGFLPGEKEEKLAPWIAPIKDNLRFLISEGKKGKFNEQILDDYFEQGIIEIEVMTFIRGRSIANAYMIVEEAQNLSLHELKTILTRAGEGTKIVLTGDTSQIDALYLDSVTNGLSIAIEKFKDEQIAGHVTLNKCERSELADVSARVLE